MRVLLGALLLGAPPDVLLQSVAAVLNVSSHHAAEDSQLQDHRHRHQFAAHLSREEEAAEGTCNLLYNCNVK